MQAGSPAQPWPRDRGTGGFARRWGRPSLWGSEKRIWGPCGQLGGDGGLRGGSARRWGRPSLWGSEIRFWVPCGQLGGDVVLVGESAEELLPADPALGVAFSKPSEAHACTTCCPAWQRT